MRYYPEHAEHALQKQQEDHKLADGRVIKHAWIWVYAVLKRLKGGGVYWLDFGDPTAIDLLGQEWVRIETNKGPFRIRATGQKISGSNHEFEFEFQQIKESGSEPAPQDPAPPKPAAPGDPGSGTP